MAKGISKNIVTLKPLHINSDVDEQYTKPSEAKYIKNYRVTFNKNENSPDVKSGQNGGVGTKLQSNRIVCDIALPSGKNVCIGAEEFEETSEVYCAIWNEAKNHSIIRIKADHTCDVVMVDPCLNFQLNPKHRLNNRMKLLVKKKGSEIERRSLIMTDGFNDQYWINIEQSIATNGFKTLGTWGCCEYIKYAVTQPILCPTTTPIYADAIPNNLNKRNLLSKRKIQFSYKFIYCDGRSSELSQYSTAYFHQDSCAGGKEPQCLDVVISAGNPLVKHIEIYVRDCGQDWYKVATLTDGCGNDCTTDGKWDKYDYNVSDNVITFRYCGNEQCVLGDQETLNMFQNDIPRKSFAVDIMGDVVALGNNLRGYDNLDCGYEDKVELSLEKIASADACPKVEMRKVRVAVYVTINYDASTELYGWGYSAIRFNLPEGEKSLLAGLRGTNYVKRGKQYNVGYGSPLVELYPFEPTPTSSFTGANYLQVYEFEVPAGKYIFEVYGYGSSIGTHKGTSSPVSRTTEFVDTGGDGSSVKELVIDVCDEDYDYRDTKWVIQIADPTGYDRFIEGYVKQGDKPVQYGYVTIFDYANFTDHYGYYFYFALQSSEATSQVEISYKDLDCSVAVKQGSVFSGVQMYREDLQVEDAFFTWVHGRLTSCADGSVGLGGINVVVSRAYVVTTDSDGWYDIYISPKEGWGIVDTILAYSGRCLIAPCDCSCMSGYAIDVDGVDCIDELVYTASLKVSEVTGSTLKSNGKYNVGFTLHDCFGRPTYVQKAGEIEMIDNVVNGLYNSFKIKVHVTNPILVPIDFKYITWFVTENQVHDDYLQWIGGVMNGCDINGDESSNDAYVSVDIKGLLDYNDDNIGNTNAIYQYVKGDIIRFLTDGSLNSLPQVVECSVIGVNIDKGVVILEYKPELESLMGTCGYKIELIHPRDCSTALNYFEVCGRTALETSYSLGDKKFYSVIPQESKVLEFTDTYYVSRTIPFREDSVCNTATFIGLESNTASDFWGNKNCKSLGRVLVENPTAQETWYPDELQKSDDYVNEGMVNGVGRFRDRNRKSFKGQMWGGFIVIHSERNILFCVLENNWFTLDFNMNYAKLSENGLIVANFEDSISDPRQKVGANYGCAYEDSNSIVFGKGSASWVDRKRGHIVLSDYQNALDIDSEGIRGYMSSKLKHIENYENGNTDFYKSWDVVSVMDYKHGEIIFTFRYRNNLLGSAVEFVNNEREPNIEISETVVYNIKEKRWVRWASCTPENYCVFKTSNKGVNMLSFANGLPFAHNNNDEDTYNTFYGVKTEQVLDLVAFVQQKEGVVHVFQSISIDSDNFKYFVDRIFTDEKNSNSYIPFVYFKRKENVYFAEILRDASSYVDNTYKTIWTSTLIDGKRVFGKWMRFRVVSTPDGLDQYDEIDTIDVQLINSELTKQ